ncbi:MAG: substrate-binding domain-containing protein, partial [Trueperaceae bacterium]
EPSRVLFTDYTPRQASDAVMRLLDGEPQCDGIFFCSDYMAVTAMEVLQGRGRRVPEEVAVIGYDDVPLARHATPNLTTVRQEIYGGGRAMAEKLIELLDGGAPEAQVLPVRLEVRASAPSVD